MLSPYVSRFDNGVAKNEGWGEKAAATISFYHDSDYAGRVDRFPYPLVDSDH